MNSSAVLAQSSYASPENSVSFFLSGVIFEVVSIPSHFWTNQQLWILYIISFEVGAKIRGSAYIANFWTCAPFGESYRSELVLYFMLENFNHDRAFAAIDWVKQVMTNHWHKRYRIKPALCGQSKTFKKAWKNSKALVSKLNELTAKFSLMSSAFCMRSHKGSRTTHARCSHWLSYIKYTTSLVICLCKSVI